MTRSFRSPSGKFDILSRRVSDKARNSQRFLDRGEAERFLRSMLAGDVSGAGLRSFALSQGVDAGRDMIGDLADELARGEIRIVRAGSRISDPPGDVVEPEKPKGGDKPAPKKDKPKKTKTAELLVIVKDADGKPVKDVEVEAKGYGTLKTEKDGTADFGEVEPGKTDITAKKPGHAKKKKGKESADEKKGEAVPEGKKTEVELVQHPLCASVAFFEGPDGARRKYYGFDHKTMMADKKTDRYWDPVPKHGDLSAHKTTTKRDGTRVVSVAVGKTVELEINFDFAEKECLPCIQNTSFEDDPDGIVEVKTETVKPKQAKFKFKGLKEGETTLRAICDGKDIGWVHVWCQEEATLKIDVVAITTKRTSGSGVKILKMRKVFDEIFRQTLINISLKNLGKVDLSEDEAFEEIEDKGYPPSGPFLNKEEPDRTYDEKETVLNAIHSAASKELDKRKLRKPRSGAYRLYHYVPSESASIGGTALNIPNDYAFCFGTEGASTYNSFAHEFGHCIGLHHPAADEASAQLPKHMHDSTDAAIPAYAKTNTEPETDAVAKSSSDWNANIMSQDPTNLMGYWRDKPNRKPLRYQQWKSVSRS